MERETLKSLGLNQKPHAVCMPVPAQGHINSMLQLAKLLHHHHHFHVTFVHTEPNYVLIRDTWGPAALAGTAGFEFESIPIESPVSDQKGPISGPDISALCVDVRNNMEGPFRRLMARLNDSAAAGVGPRVTCVVGDTFASFSQRVAAEMGIPAVSFCSLSACGLMGCFSYKELVAAGLAPLKSESDLNNGYLDTPVDSIPGMKNIRLRDLPSFVRTTNPHDVLLNFCIDETQDTLKASAVVINTFDELEGPVVDALSAQFPPIYTVGPLNLPCRQISDESLISIGSSMWKNDTDCLLWLDGRSPRSVVYMNLGSIAVMSEQQLLEFAWGLANSGYDFLWVMRPELIVEGELSKILPEEFFFETKERGLITSWCSQEEVLRHSSVGGFLTHCGWNSTLEGITAGVPMICWPYFGDQQTNCRYLCSEWRIGVEIEEDVRREKVEKAIREVMGEERGGEMRRMAMEWKEKAENSMKPDGSSFLNYGRMVKEVILHLQG